MELSPLQAAVFKVLKDNPNMDVHITRIHDLAYKDRHRSTTRQKQQRLGSILSRINTKLKKGKIRPGDARQTYRYDTTG